MNRRSFVAALCAAVVLIAQPGLRAETYTVIVKSAAALPQCPLMIPAAGMPDSASPVLKDSTGAELPAQFVTAGGERYLAAVVPLKARNSASSFSIAANEGATKGGGGVRARIEAGAVEVLIGGQPFARHNYESGPKPYLWPLYAPGQVDVTRSYPMKDVAGEDQDHPHHRGLWFTHGSINGVDFWAEGEGKGKVVQTSMRTQSGPACAVVTTANDWVAADGRKICEDERTMVFWNTEDPRAIDFCITLKATEAPLVFGDTKEGTFAIRVPRWMTVKAGTGHIVTSEAMKDGDAWGKRASWVDYYGTHDARTSGVAFIEFPGNFRYPTYWHARDYGLFAANPFGIRDFTGDAAQSGQHDVPKGGTFTLRYRILLHSGDAAQANVDGFDAQLRVKDPVTVVRW